MARVWTGTTFPTRLDMLCAAFVKLLLANGGHIMLCASRACIKLLVHPPCATVIMNGQVMFNIARANLANGLSVVVDCPLAHLWLYRRAEELATQVGNVTHTCLPGLPHKLCHTCLAASPGLQLCLFSSTTLCCILCCDLQAGAKVVVVECSCSDEVLWRQRLEQRGQQDAGTPQAHKPGTWAVLQATLTRSVCSMEPATALVVPLCNAPSSSEGRSIHDRPLFAPLSAAGSFIMLRCVHSCCSCITGTMGVGAGAWMAACAFPTMSWLTRLGLARRTCCDQH